MSNRNFTVEQQANLLQLIARYNKVNEKTPVEIRRTKSDRLHIQYKGINGGNYTIKGEDDILDFRNHIIYIENLHRQKIQDEKRARELEHSINSKLSRNEILALRMDLSAILNKLTPEERAYIQNEIERGA